MNTKTLILLICLFAMSQQHGVHRVAQSMWNYPNFGATTKLYLYFSLDDALPAGGLMNIALPTSMAAFVPTTCNAWALTTTLAPPASTSGFIIGQLTSNTGCRFYTYSSTATGNAGAAVGLDANTAYGVELYMSGGGVLAIGSYAPIAITTRSGFDGTNVANGPMLGCNPAFDMVFVSAQALGFTTAVTRVLDATSPACVGTACNSAKNQPGDAAQYIFTIGTWTGTTTATVIPAPYNIEFSFAKSTNSAAGYVYGTWSFETSATSCTSLQFGPALSNGTKVPMNTVKPTCSYAANSDSLFVKTISVTDTADSMTPVSGAWSTWIVSFQMQVTNPSDVADTNPTLTTRIVHPTKNFIYAQSLADATTVFKVVIAARASTTFGVTGDSVARVAFGANPMSKTGHLYGAGIYSETYCVGSAQYNLGQSGTDTSNVATVPSNCAAGSANNINANIDYLPTDPQPARSVNAIELAWTIPLAIPADTTSSVVTCEVDKTFASTNAKFRFFTIHQSSLVTDVAKGNCWYSSTYDVSSSLWQREIVTCTEMGAIAANDILTIAFQFEIFQRPYIAYAEQYIAADVSAQSAADYTNGGQVLLSDATGHNKVWDKGSVKKTINTLTCQMIITAGTKTWYTQSIVIPVDGSITAQVVNDFAMYQTFISQVPAGTATNGIYDTADNVLCSTQQVSDTDASLIFGGAACAATSQVYSQHPKGIDYEHTTGQWLVKTDHAAGSLTHTWQTQATAAGTAFKQAGTGSQSLIISLMFYIGDTYTALGTAWDADLVAGRRIPMAISAVMNLKFYLYGAHTFSANNKLSAQWQGYDDTAKTGASITGIFLHNTETDSVTTDKVAFYFGTWASGNSGGTEGGLNLCPDDTTWSASIGLCNSKSVFDTPDVSKEGGKVLIHSTSQAGGITTGDDSTYLMKACITNGNLPSSANSVHLKNMFQGCKFSQAKYPAGVGGANPVAVSADFYVMFSGALVSTNTAAITATSGYKSANFIYDSNIYGGANYATFHKFEYVDAYTQSAVTWMTTFRGRGGVGSSAKQGLETFFWSVKDNTTTSTTGGWVISTMIHTYIAPAATAVAFAATKVLVSWPAWVESTAAALSPADENNNGLLFFNTMKITVQDGFGKTTIFTTNNAYIGTFVPRGQAFMKSTGDNEVEVSSTDSTTKCYLYGSATGQSYGVTVVGAAKKGNQEKDATRLHTAGYALQRQLSTNFMVCSIGTVTSTGVVTIIPFTNIYAGVTDEQTSELSVLQSSDWLWAIMLVIGTDRNMHGAYWYPTSLALATTDYLTEVSGANQVFFVTGQTILTSTAGLTSYQVDGVAHDDFIIGATGVTSKITCTLDGGSAQDWLTKVRDMAQICGDNTYLMGSNAGDVNSGTALATTVDKLCLKSVINVKVSSIIYPRECWFCPIEAATSMSWVIKSFTVPVTSDRLVVGFTTIVTTVNGGLYIHPEADAGTVLSNVGTITQCGVSPASIQYNVKGQSVAWSVTSPTPLAGGWTVKFVGDNSASGVFTVTVVPGSVVATCGTAAYYTSSTSAQDMVLYTTSGDVVQFVLPAVAQTTAPALTTYAAGCAGGSKYTATVQNWKAGTGSSSTKFTDGRCVITNGQGAHATEMTGATDAVLGAVSMASSSLSFDSSVAGTASTLGISSVSFYPTVAASYGRFRFVPVMGAGPALYAGQSTFTYTFGSATFATGAVCKITDTTFATQMAGVSSCVASSSSVVIKMGVSATSVTFGVEVYGVTANWAQTAQAITASLSNFNDPVQNNPTSQVELAALPATQTVKPTIVLAKTYVNTMDLGTFQFTATINTVNGTFNSSQWAMINFPTYYRADLGAGVLCTLNFNGTTTEPVWCELMWDYTLKVWGPILNPMVAAKAFNITVMGVDNVNPATATNFQVGFSAMSTTNYGASLAITDSNCLMEFMTVADTTVASGWAAAATSLKVWSYTSSSANTRGTTQVSITFQVPVTTANTLKDITLGYVTLHLPRMWGSVIMATSSLTTKLEQQAITTPFAFSEIGATSPATFSGCSVTVWMTGTTNKFVAGSNYTLTVGGIPTSQSAVSNTGLMYPVVSVGKQTTGGLGWSDSMHNWEPLTNPTFAVATGYTEVQFSATSYTVNQGTFTAGLCIMPTGTSAKFNSDIEFAIVGTTFVTAPAKLSAKQGDVSVCAALGTASTTALSWYWVSFTHASTKYTALPNLKVQVSNTKGQVTNTNEAACTLGYSSIPIKVGYSVAPFSDVIVSLNAKAKVNASITAASAANEPSYGLTPNTGASSVTLTQLVSSGILSFKCDATLNTTVTTKLWYNLTGTDMASFTLQNADVKATGLVNRSAEITSPVLVLTQDNTTSTSAMTNLNVGCPEVGTAYVWFAPSATTKPTAATGAAVKSLADAYLASTEVTGYSSAKAHLGEQWFQIPITSTNSPPVAADYVSAMFHTVSNKTMTSMLYCFTSTEYFYPLSAALMLTSKDNGGKVSNIELTYTKYFDEALNNADLLKVAGAMATGVMISNDRVTDRWGGISGAPSQYVPTTAFTPQTAVTPVANTTNTTANTTNTTTRLLATTYPVNLFIQPDPTAATALDSAAWTTAITGIKTELSAAVTTYGAVAAVTASAAAPSITEAAVAFSTDPAATSNADGSSVAVAGAVAGDAYVYCAFQKTGTAAATTTTRILQNTTANTTANTTTAATTTTATTTTAAVATSMLSWSDATWTASYSFMRSTTTAAVPAFTQSYNTTGGSTYKWACQGTSLNPVAANAQFKTAYKEGSVTANVATVVGAGSLFTTIASISFIIIAAFFY